jgi:hypothetical protein
MLKRKITVPLKRYAHPDYLRDLCNRVEQCYFSHDRDWSCIEAIFNLDIKAMEQREPRPPAADHSKSASDSMKASRRRMMGNR